MRNVFSKMLTGSMVASAALLVAACGGTETAETDNTMATDMNAMDPAMTGTTNDVSAIDAATGADANMAMDANMGMDANMAGGNMAGGDANMSGNMTGGTTGGTTGGNMTGGTTGNTM